MKILNLLKNLISRNKTKRLNAYSIDMGATAKMITIDAIEQIIQNPEIYEKFKDYEKNRTLFGDENEEADYIRDIKYYADFMRKNGIKFSKEENKRIKAVLKGVNFYNEKEVKKDELFQGEKREKLYSIMQKVLKDEKSFEEFLDKNIEFDGINKNIIEEYAYSELSELFFNIEYSDEQKKRLNFIKTNLLLKDKSSRMKADFEINHDFENSIMKNIDKNLKCEELAFAIYNELNKKVKYNPAFFALNQDLENEFAKAIYDKKITEVSKEDNKIVCQTWAELYAYLLEKNGIEAYITSKGKHKYVSVFNGKTRIEADATNLTNSNEDTSRLTDLARCKLGMKPAGFKIYNYDVEKDIGEDLDIIKSDYTDTDYRNFEDTEELSELLTLIDDNKKRSDAFFEIEDNESQIKTILKKLTYIKELVKESKLDNMDSVAYISHLFRNIINEEENNRVGLSNSLYENVYTDCNILSVISIYKGKFGPNNERLDDDYSFLIYDQNNQVLRKVTKEEIIQKVQSKKYGRIKSKEKYRIIDGIPEIDMNLDEQKDIQNLEEIPKNIFENNKRIISDEGR